MDFYEYEALLEQENNLTHHGIFGQKWGHRNGPPYPIEPGKHSAAEKRENPELDKQPKKRSYKELNNQELREVNERLRLENEFIRQKYEQMKYAEARPIKSGKDYVKTITAVAAGVGATLVTADKVAKLFGFDMGEYIKNQMQGRSRKAIRDKYGIELESLDDDMLKSNVDRLELENKFIKLKQGMGM